MKKILILGLAAIIAAGSLYAGNNIRLGSGGVNGNYYPMAKDIEMLYTPGPNGEQPVCEGVTLDVREQTGGSMGNAKDMGNKKLDAGIIQIDVLKYLKKSSRGKFTDKKYKIIAQLHKESMHLMIPLNYKPKSPKSSGWGSFFSKFSTSKPVILDINALKGQVIESTGGSVISAKALSQVFNLGANVIDTKGQWTGENPILLVGGQPLTAVEDILATGTFALVQIDHNAVKAIAPFYVEDELSYEMGGSVQLIPSIGVQAVLVGKSLRNKAKNLRMENLATCINNNIEDLADDSDTNNNWESVYDLNQKDLDLDWDEFNLLEGNK